MSLDMPTFYLLGGAGGGVEVEELVATQNGTYTAEEGKAYSPVTVDVPVPTLETKSVAENGNYDAPSGKAYNRIEVSVPQTEVEELSVTENGTYTAEEGTAYSPVTVDVMPNVGSKSITANGNYSSSSDNLDGYSSVTVNVPLPTLETKSITANGSYDAPSGKAYNRVEVSVPNHDVFLDRLIRRSQLITEISEDDLSVVTGNYIGRYAFAGCSELVTVHLPARITDLADGAFFWCVKLKNINLENVPWIGNECFKWCGLESVVLSPNMTLLASNVFNGCNSLKSITLPAVSPPTYATNALFGTPNDMVIYVPAASVSAYQSASGWSAYASRIQAIPNS